MTQTQRIKWWCLIVTSNGREGCGLGKILLFRAMFFHVVFSVHHQLTITLRLFRSLWRTGNGRGKRKSTTIKWQPFTWHTYESAVLIPKRLADYQLFLQLTELSEIMIFYSFLQSSFFYFVCWLEKATQKYISFSVSAHQDGDASEGKGKKTQTTPHMYFLVVLPELLHVKSRNTEDRAYQNCLQTITFTTFPAALPTLHFSAQNFPEPPRLGKSVRKVMKAQATLFAQSSPHGQHLCVCLSSPFPCPEILRVGAHGSGGTYWMGTAEKAQPISGCGTKADCPEKIPPGADFRKYVVFISKQTMSHWLSHGRKWDYKGCISK